jgi:kynurenine formamidase
MKIIDLSQPLFDKMPVFPGDPEVSIQEIHTIEKNGWNMRNMTFTTHIGTHVNVPYHMVPTGEKLGSFSLDRFIGRTELYKKGIVMKRNRGVFFTSCTIDSKIVEQILIERPKFI